MTGDQTDRAAIIKALDLSREAADCILLSRPEDALPRLREVCLVLHKRLAGES